jgi:molybdopterin-guanine dinucleotide biosynthesis protein A
MRFPFPAAVLAGGASRRMGRPKASLPFGSGTLLQHQIVRVAPLFSEVFVVVKDAPDSALGRARILLDSTPRQGAIFGLTRALEEVEDHLFVMAVDTPVLAPALIAEIARRGLKTAASVLLPRAGGRLQPLAAVWRRAVLPLALQRIASEQHLSLQELAQEAGVEVLEEAEWRRFDPSGNSFENLNTLEEYVAARERA